MKPNQSNARACCNGTIVIIYYKATSKKFLFAVSKVRTCADILHLTTHPRLHHHQVSYIIPTHSLRSRLGTGRDNSELVVVEMRIRDGFGFPGTGITEMLDSMHVVSAEISLGNICTVNVFEPIEPTDVIFHYGIWYNLYLLVCSGDCLRFMFLPEGHEGSTRWRKTPSIIHLRTD